MGVTFLIAFFIVSFLIIGLVLLQEGKGGGLTGMSAGMDGVMGARNPLRRMTAYLFAVFILMAIGINWYFHQGDGTALPPSAVLPDPARMLQETAPLSGIDVVPENSLRPDAESDDGADPIRPDAAPAAPVMSIRPETGTDAPAESVAPPDAPAAPEPSAATPDAPAANLRPEDASDSAAPSLTPPETTAPAEPIAPPAAETR